MNMPAQGTDQWHAARKGRITASVVGKIITGNGEDDVLRDMVRDALGYPRAFTGNVATEYGHANEDIARTEYAMETGRSPVETGFHIHPKHDWLGASPDGLVGDDGLIEIKCPFKLRDAVEVPDELLELGDRDLYWHQIQCQMAVMGRDWCDFVVWCPGEIKVKRYHRDNVWIGTATDTCLPWLEYLKDVLADPEEAERVADMTRDMSEDEDWLKVAQEYAGLDVDIKRKKAQQDELRTALVEMAGERRASGGGISVSPVQRAGSVDYKAMAADSGVDIEQYRKPASTGWQVRANSKENEL